MNNAFLCVLALEVKEEYNNDEEDEVDGHDVVQEFEDKEEDGDEVGEETQDMSEFQLKVKEGRRMKIISLTCRYPSF